MDPQIAGRFWVFIQLVQLGEPIITSQYDMGQKPTSKIGMQHDASLKQGCMIWLPQKLAMLPCSQNNSTSIRSMFVDNETTDQILDTLYTHW